MKYDELIKQLRCYAKSEEDALKHFIPKLAMASAADAIEKLLGVIQRQRETINATAYFPLYPKPMKWIPVTERLPNGESDRYLVAYDFMSHLRVAICYYADNLEKVCKYDFAGRTDNGFYAYDDEYGFYEKTDVRYWMPLPEMPKEET